MNIDEKEKIWKEYFDKLLNTEEPRELIKKGNEEISKVGSRRTHCRRCKKGNKKLKK